MMNMTPAGIQRLPPKVAASRDRSTLKERINRLSTLERSMKEESLKKLMPKTIHRINHTVASGNVQSLLHKFKIQQLKQIPLEKSRSSKESGSGGPQNQAAMVNQSSDSNFREGMEALKNKIKQLPGRSLIDFNKVTNSSSSKSGNKDSLSRLDEQIDINLYKKPSRIIKDKREGQSSLKMMEARRGMDSTIENRNQTVAAASFRRSRIRDIQ